MQRRRPVGDYFRQPHGAASEAAATTSAAAAAASPGLPGQRQILTVFGKLRRTMVAVGGAFVGDYDNDDDEDGIAVDADDEDNDNVNVRRSKRRSGGGGDDEDNVVDIDDEDDDDDDEEEEEEEEEEDGNSGDDNGNGSSANKATAARVRRSARTKSVPVTRAILRKTVKLVPAPRKSSRVASSSSPDSELDEHTSSAAPLSDRESERDVSASYGGRSKRTAAAMSTRRNVRVSAKSSDASHNGAVKRVYAKRSRRAAAAGDNEDEDDEDDDEDEDDEDDDERDDESNNDQIDDDDESVKVRSKKAAATVAVAAAPPASTARGTRAPSTRRSKAATTSAGGAVDASEEEVAQSPAQSSRGKSRVAAAPVSAAAAAAAPVASSSQTAAADAIVNRTRSHRAEPTDRVTRRSGGGGGGAAVQERAFANHDSGPMASRVIALPAGLLDRRMHDLDLSEIDMERRVHLSRGAVSDVYKVRWCGVSAVLKQWHANSDAERFKNEVEITRLCQFPRVVQLFGASLEHRVMLIERLGRGNLRQVLTSEKYTLSSIERRLRNWALEVCEAMAFVHANGVIHYDLKSQNVLVTMSWHTRLCDFSHSVYVGVAADARGAGAAEWGQVGSLEITAPEVFTQRQRTPKSDVYSFGLLLWEMLSYGETPFLQYCTDSRALQTYVCAPINGRPPLKSTWDPHCKDIMRRAWQPDPAQRPTFAQLVVLLSSNAFVR